MAADATSICNLALGELGAKSIMSLEDASAEGRACNRFYSQTRDEVLRAHQWNFATARTVLSQLEEAPEFGWDYQYQLPSDFLRIRSLNDIDCWDGHDRYDIEGRTLLTDLDEANLRYIYRCTDGTLYDSLFVEALATKLAARIAAPLTGSQQLGLSLMQKYEQVLIHRARRIDASESRPKDRLLYQSSNFVRSRYGSALG